MAHSIGYRVQSLMSDKTASVEFLSVERARGFVHDTRYAFIDVRDQEEQRREGIIPGAFTCPQGMVGVWTNPQCLLPEEIFNPRQGLIFYCSKGWRSSVSAKLALDMGFAPVMNLVGGIAAWKDKGEQVEFPAPFKAGTPLSEQRKRNPDIRKPDCC